jgi:hypothetical protein
LFREAVEPRVYIGPNVGHCKDIFGFRDGKSGMRTPSGVSVAVACSGAPQACFQTTMRRG